jgi:NAD(P)-dependent dehydrogenase (short-subunit alcohol dehydrogenase family)
VTGSTDGIGQHTASNLALSPGYKVFVHGRNAKKVKATVEALKAQAAFPGSGDVEGFVADLGSFRDVRGLAQEMGDRCVGPC